MSNHALPSKLPGTGDDPFNNPNDVDEVRPAAVTDPNAVVDGMTILQWSEVWLRTMVDAPGGPINSFNDPNGTVAAAINDPHSPMYFITGAPSGERTFFVHRGQDVFVPVGGQTDGEGPQIGATLDPAVFGSFGGPGEPSFADEVLKVLSLVTVSNVKVTLDGKPVNDLKETNTGIFFAGVAQPGSEALDFFGTVPGASLAATGQVGYFAVLENLGSGKHTFTSTSTVSFLGHTSTQTHTDIIRVV
jgi:hypothetical protein